MKPELQKIMEDQSSDGILEMMVDRDGSAFLLERFFASMDETEVAEWMTWFKSSLETKKQLASKLSYEEALFALSSAVD